MTTNPTSVFSDLDPFRAGDNKNGAVSSSASTPPAKAASTGDVEKAINTACKSKGGVYNEYSCKYVSWDDAERGTVGGGLSCWGGNITDTYLKEKTGKRLFTVRSDNWNEKLGSISSDKVAVVVGNTDAANPGKQLTPVTLKNFLTNIGEYGAYANVPGDADLSSADLDQKVSIRFQTTFLPIDDTPGSDGTLEFCTEAYNYNTTDDSNPRNLVVLGTTQGIAIQQDGRGTKKIMHHGFTGGLGDSQAHKYWLEAERSRHKVGGAQKETEEERLDAAKRGKATAAVIGIPAMGTRFNALLTIQIPLKQRQTPVRNHYYSAQKKKSGGPMASLFGLFTNTFAMAPAPAQQPGGIFECCDDLLGGDCDYENSLADSDCDDCDECEEWGEAMPMAQCDMLCDMPSPPPPCAPCAPCAAPMTLYRGMARARAAPSRPKTGTANAARVSRGSDAGVYNGLSVKTPLERDPSQHITVTIVLYNTVAGGVPSQDDVVAAIDDMEALYAACNWSGRLADAGADFMKSELTVKTVQDIATKVTTQPPVANFDVFPQ